MAVGKLIKLTWSDGPSQTTETVTGFLGGGDTNWEQYSPVISGFGIVTKDKMFWRRSGPDILIRGEFTIGIPEASNIQIPFPNNVKGALTASSVSELVYFAGSYTDRFVNGTCLLGKNNGKGNLCHGFYRFFNAYPDTSGGGAGWFSTDGNIYSVSGERFTFFGRFGTIKKYRN